MLLFAKKKKIAEELFKIIKKEHIFTDFFDFQRD